MFNFPDRKNTVLKDTFLHRKKFKVLYIKWCVARVHGTTNDFLHKDMFYTCHAKCMTLSVLELSLPMQRNHHTFSCRCFCLKLMSWIVTVQMVTYCRKNNHCPLRSEYGVSALGCEPWGATSLQAILSSQEIWFFGHSAVRVTLPYPFCLQELHPSQ